MKKILNPIWQLLRMFRALLILLTLIWLLNALWSKTAVIEFSNYQEQSQAYTMLLFLIVLALARF